VTPLRPKSKGSSTSRPGAAASHNMSRHGHMLRSVLVCLCIVLVPLSVSGQTLPSILAMGIASIIATRFGLSWRMASVLLGYCVPLLFQAPWPTHCLVAGAVWCLGDPSSLSALRCEPRTVSRFLMLIPLLMTTGAASGAMVLLIGASQIQGMTVHLPFPFPSEWGLKLALIVVSAAVNSFGEELMWRGFLNSATREVSLTGRFILQSLTFGVSHWYGVPNGACGAVTAAAYSAIIFEIRRRYGFWSAWLTHFVTDMVIFFFVVEWASFSWGGWARNSAYLHPTSSPL
jgi:membrane protease YdiL (CAAX protease family)